MAQTTYTWVGGTDTDWNNELNWTDIGAYNGIPEDDNTGDAPLSLPEGSEVVFDGATMPDTNVPEFGGAYDGGANGGTLGSPKLILNSGGLLSMSINNPNRGFWSNVAAVDKEFLTVGDGIGAAGEVSLTFTNDFDRIGRHNVGEFRVRVNSDGILTADLSCSRWGNNGARSVKFLIDGGTIHVRGVISGSNYNDDAFEFLSVGGELNFEYGGNHADNAAVLSAIGSKFVTNLPDTVIKVTDLADSGFGNPGASLTLIAAEPNYWTGTGGATWDQNTTLNFSTNVAADPLVVADFDTANAAVGIVTFADEYTGSGGPFAVTQSNINIAAGGVAASGVVFENSAVAYTLNSSDANGLATATSVNVDGGGSVTFTGTHAYTGGTSVGAGSTLNLGDGSTDGTVASVISNAGSLVIDLVADATYPNTSLQGSGSVEKKGSGTLTVGPSQFPDYTGATILTEGKIVFINGDGSDDDHHTSGIAVASGATVEYNAANGGYNVRGNLNVTGEGTFLKTGAGQLRWKQETLDFGMSSGALLHIQEGAMQGSSSADDVWTSNLSDLQVDSGASFLGQEGNVRVDAINGDGEIRTGLDHAYYVDGFTFGVDNGSGSFDGVLSSSGSTPDKSFFVKEGTGTQEFNGDNAGFIGDFIIENGTVLFDFDSVMYFYPEASGVSNSISGTASGTADLGGIFVIDTSGAVAAPGSSWVIVDTTGGMAANYDSFFIVQTPALVNWTSPSTGVWTLEEGIGTYTFTESTGTLTFDVAAGANLFTGINGATWDQATTANFSDNDPADPISNVDFDTATASSLNAIFADEYYADGSNFAVGSSTVTIAAGGVEIIGGGVTFANVTVPYVIESTDVNGIKGATNLDVNGSITLRGTHATTGTTTVGGGINLTLDAPTAASLVSPIVGGGNLVKTGVDTMTLSADNTYTGSTTVTTGTLKVTNNSDTTAVSIAAGATFEMDFNVRWGGVTSYTGEGTILKTGTGTADFFKGTFALAAGSLIDVQEGTFRASSGGTGGSEVWTNNMSDIFIASGATFRGAEGNINMSALDGAGTFSSGFSSAGYTNITIGLNDGGGTFSGIIEDTQRDLVLRHIGHVTKVGTGTQTLAGLNTYTGNTSVEDGTLVVATTGALTFAPEGNGVINTVSGPALGTGVVTLEGSVNFNIAEADTTPGNTWVIIDDTNITFSYGVGLFGVTSDGEVFVETVPGVSGIWEADFGGNLWTYTESTYTLTVAAGTPVSDPNEVTIAEFAAGFVFDGTDASFSFSVLAGSTYEIRRTADLTVDLAFWDIVYGPTASVLDETITPTDLASGLPDAFYVLIITPTP